MLLEKLKLDAGEPVFEKAVSYYQTGNIKSYAFTQQGNSRYQIKAIVKASGAYGVNIKLDFIYNQVKIDHYCTCGSNQLCEHATAVAYKFISDDLPKFNSKLIKPAPAEGIELLKLVAVCSSAKAELHYTISGLDNQAENFQLTFNSQERDETFLSQLVEGLGDINYSAGKREQLLNSLTGFDYLVVTYLENILTGKDPRRKSVFFSKSKENLQLIITLIQNSRVISNHTSQPLEFGETLKPRVYLSGDEVRLQFTYDLAQFELLGFFDQNLNYVINDNTLHLIETSVLEKLPAEIIIAPEQLGEVLFEILPKLAEKVQLELAPIFQFHQLVLQEPELSLYFNYQQETVVCQPQIKLLDQVYCYQDCWQLLHREPSYKRSYDDPQRWLAINRQPFAELLNFLQQNKFEFSATEWVMNGQGQQLKFMMNGLEQLSGKWPVTTGSGFTEFQITPVKLVPLVEMAIDEKIDWFDLNIYYNLGGQTYSHQQISLMLRRTDSGNYLQLGNQWFFIEESAKFDLLEQTFIPGAKKTGPITEKCYNILFFRQLLREHEIEIKGNALYCQFETDVASAGLIETSPLPESLQGTLRPYQKDGFYWLRFLHKYHFGGILADDMGLGKTLQVLTLVKSLPKDQPTLVVCPRSLIYNWAAEIEKFYPGTTYLVYHGSPETREMLRSTIPDQEFVITTYDIIVNDIETLQNYSFYYCILDEAQQIKNQQTQRARDTKKINSRYRLILTGTPVENRLEDLWSLFDFLMPGYLENHHQFKEKYVSALKKPGLPDSLELLRKKIAPFMLRRLKETVLTELPPKMEIQRNVMMTQLQEDVYRTILKQTKQEVLNSISNLGLNKSRITVLAALTKLRQLCDHPSLALPEISAEADSGKIDALMELIFEAIDSGHKMVVFSQFVRMLKLIRAKLNKAQINYVYLDGSTSDRMERINCFNNNPEIPVFLISLKAGGVGINLTAADIVIHTDPWWNPMVEQQATDRVHRMGQQRQVMVYKLVTIGTVEEKLVKLQKRKKALFDAIIQANGDPVDSLTWEDIRELFEL